MIKKSQSVSKRSQIFLKETPPLVHAHFKCAEDPYHEENNPQGYINLGTAENFLNDSQVKEKFQELSSNADFNFHYDFPQGSQSLREAFKKFGEKFFSLEDLSLNNISIASGASAIIEILTHTLLDEGDEVLLMAPLYNGFYHDIEVRFKGVIRTSYCLEKNYFDEKVFEEDILRNKNLRTVLINNPHNPTGYCLTREEIEKIILICKKYNLQIISDEIYANSVYGKNEFTSFLNPCFNGLDYKESIHGVYGLAKDFCMSGLKVGICYTYNNDVGKAVAAQSYFHTVSTQTQNLAASLLSDLQWCETLFSQNKEKLLELSQNTIKKLASHGIKAFQPTAGIFLWIDLGGKIEQTSFEAESNLAKEILDKLKVNITPGQAFASKTPGYFRLCFAKEPDVIDVAIARLSQL